MKRQMKADDCGNHEVDRNSLCEFGLQHKQLVQKKDYDPDIHKYIQNKYFIASYSGDDQVFS